MNQPRIFPDPMSLDRRADLETVLEAWHGATVRLEQTHEALRSEVHRLTNELEVKNRELARKNRLADLGQMASHVAHEVRNNLVPVRLYLSLLRRRIADDHGSLDVLGKVEAGFFALENAVGDLLGFASDRDPQLSNIQLKSLVDEVCASISPQLAAQQIDVCVDVSPHARLTADCGMLKRALLNLALNAVDAMPQGGRLTITSHVGSHGVEIEVADTGPGLSDEARRRAFEPFFTTKPTGTGLGLAIVYRIAEVHFGNVVVTNCPEGGAAFTLRLPQKRCEAAA